MLLFSSFHLPPTATDSYINKCATESFKYEGKDGRQYLIYCPCSM